MGHIQEVNAVKIENAVFLEVRKCMKGLFSKSNTVSIK